jgi:hypothetical protein
MASPYFDSANRQVDESKKGLLEAVATGGTAGKQAFDAAQAQAAQAKQDAVARAAERSALYGVGGNDQTFLGAYDARANQMGVNRANFESGLAQTQASGSSYLEKARSSIPLLEAQNIGKVTDQETKIKLAIEAAKQKAMAEQEKEQRSLQRTLDSESRAEARALARENRAESRSSAKEARALAAKEPKLPTANQLLGQGQTIADKVNAALKSGTTYGAGTEDVDNAVFLANEMGGVGNNGVTADNAARAYAKSLGLSEGVVAGILTPMATGSWSKASAPVKDEYASALASKYASKGVSPALAKSVVNNVDFQAATAFILNGAIDPATNQPMTRDQLEQWIRREFITKDGRNWQAEYNVLTGEYLKNQAE